MIATAEPTRVSPSDLPAPYFEDGNGIVLYHADCRDILPYWKYPEAVMVTDPPYGISFRSGMNGGFGESRIAGDESADLRDWALSWLGDRPAVVFGSWKVARPANTRHVLIWDKGEHVGMGDLEFPWKPNAEEIYVLGKGFSGRRSGSVIRYHAIAGTVAVTQGRHHPTEKPRSLMRDLIAKCPPGLIVDPFAGSGTTLLAARDLGRAALGIELREDHCATAVERLRQQVLPL